MIANAHKLCSERHGPESGGFLGPLVNSVAGHGELDDLSGFVIVWFLISVVVVLTVGLIVVVTALGLRSAADDEEQQLRDVKA
ncbi:hypothetical protein ACU8KH_05872 [Lachancea thermotolerans]